MKKETINLETQTGRKFKVDFFNIDNLNSASTEDAPRPLMIVFPGGYFMHHSKKEIDPVVNVWLQEGYRVAVVYYNLVIDGGQVYPDAGLCGLETIKYFRENATEYAVLPDKISTIGFSAGGHVAAIVNSMLNDPSSVKEYNLTDVAKPNATILVYPFIDFAKLDLDLTPEQLAAIPENKLFHNATTGVTKETPPTMVIHATNDPVVPVTNGLGYFNALQENGVETEGLFLNAGVHGFSVATPIIGQAGNESLEDKHLAHWVGLAKEWLARVLDK